MANQTQKIIGSGIFGFLGFVWTIYDRYTTVKDLPNDAGEVSKMIADPPVYAPYVVTALFIIALGWLLWRRFADPVASEDEVASNIMVGSNVFSGPINAPLHVGHNIGPFNFNTTGATLRGRFRSLMEAIDARILDAIKPTSLSITTRMTDAQFQRFKVLLEENGSDKYVETYKVVRHHRGCQISNGTYGPITAEHIQHELDIKFQKEFCG